MNTILYITYIDMMTANSGSRVRPKKIYETFLNMNYNVKLLKGVASKENREERMRNIREIKEWLKTNKPQYCYIESPSDPIIFKQDRNLIKLIHKKGIKIGYFYRDAYYKLGKDYIFNNKKVNVFSKKYLKYIYYKFLFWRDEQLIKHYVDIVYFPSESMTQYFNFKNMRALPPAGEIIEFRKDENADSLIYVGGISENYGIDYLLEAMKKINEKQYVKLILVCRKEEMTSIDKKYVNEKWLEICNVSGIENLKPLYEKAKIALIPKKPSIYNNFAISVKIFEYMSFNLPIVAINTTETAKIIQHFNIGLISKDNAEEFAETILKLYNNEELYNQLSYNVKKALINDNLWESRVKQINEELTNL